ncbi:bifunctional aminoglycoside phosphotransferase/ATP-binding protein [Bradyrhizobium sp. ARR65]|uniref:bifunctional aminoglycoside phosphotransferase/ATP-binding protein n=1 Tax=Bradyrhizobium sp. ARR65 TaxID=1040989 RepID=UPI000AB94F7C|nr:bifunctional aminoglycoside phosphotransferase/ATP-binding protein [Bradyrhizobium sp. ARR65]
MVSATNDSHLQQRVFAFLTDPAAHPHVQRIDTHAASVFLEGNRALKIKRAVRFPFLDYSTLEKRKAACDEELKVNRQFAPQIYRRVVPITQTPDGSLSIDGNGTPVEYAVEMTRFDERRTIDHLARAGALNRDLVDAVADAIAASHLTARHVAADSWLQSIPKIIEDNTAALRTASLFSAGDVEQLGKASQAAFSRLRDLLQQRGKAGFVRRCHGDLHLANIVVIAGKPVLFDAIEFDEKIASTDVLYDMAFPLMDLLRYGRREAANALLNRYLAVTPAGNLDALSSLSLLMSMRAAIRAHVLAVRIDPAKPGKAAAITEDARAYFDLAKRLIDPSPPTLIAVGGLSGTGKSVLARALAPGILPEPGSVVLRSDVLRKQLFGRGEKEALPGSAYRAEVSRDVYDILAERAGRVISQGHSAIADAVFAREAERTAIADVARSSNVRFIGIFLVADLQTRQARVSQRDADASDATAEVARLQEQYELGNIDWTIIDASGTPEATARACRARIAASK